MKELHLIIALIIVTALLVVTIILLFESRRDLARSRRQSKGFLARIEKVNKFIYDRLAANRKIIKDSEQGMELNGMQRMDHGALFELMQKNPHSGADALVYFIPYKEAQGEVQVCKDILKINKPNH